jgi:hypothetical protein
MPSLCPELQSKLAAHLDITTSDVTPGSLSTPKAHETDRQTDRQTDNRLRQATFVSYSVSHMPSTTAQLA